MRSAPAPTPAPAPEPAVDAAAVRAADGGPGDPAVPGGLVFLAWGAVAGRSAEIAAVLGGEAVSLYPPGPGRRPHASLRYVACTLATVRRLRRRPGFVVVTNPPVLAGLVAAACGRRYGFPVALDSHPGAFGAQGDGLSRRLLPLHRALAGRVAFSMVAAAPWAAQVTSWGGRAVVVHEAPGFRPTPPPPRRGRLRVLCVGRLAADEPVAAVLEAAGRAPGCELLVTGDPGRLGEAVRSSAPDNVRFVGFLDAAAYGEAVAGAHAVLTLTTEPASVMRAAYEAVYAGRPLVVSDWPIGRETFPFAVHVANDAASIAAGLGRLVEGYEDLVAACPEARRVQVARWQGQERALRQEIATALGRR